MFNRFTGLAQSGIMYGYAILAVASSQNHAALLAQVQGLGLGPAVITAAKFAIAWPFVYHLFNGLRHLVKHNLYHRRSIYIEGKMVK